MNVTYPYNEVITKLAYPYEMIAAEKKQLLNKLKTLRPGEPYEAVVKLLGPPYIQSIRAGKERNAPVRGTSVTYYLKKVGDGVNVKHDQFVELDFDNDKKLLRLDVQNLEGLSQQIANLPVTEYTWDDTSKQMQIIEKHGDKRGTPGVSNDDKNTRK